MKLKGRSVAATIGGLITSVCTAAALIDFDTFDWSKTSDKLKLIVIVMPAIGGWLSEFKPTKKKESPEN